MSHDKRVADVMTRDVVSVEQNERLLSADQLMRAQRIRHLPVVDGEGALAGIVTQRDLFHGGLVRALGYGSHARDQALDQLAVKEAMHNEVVTTTPETPLGEAARTMLEKKIGCLVVVNGPTIVGILTEADFVKLALE
jgi:CBS domain-containing protein